jgi:general secretion pathway protein L
MTEALSFIRTGIGAFFAWWFGELAGLVPRGLIPGRRQARRGTLLLLAPGGASFHRGGRLLGRSDAPEPERSAELGALWRRARGRNRRLTIRLARSQGLVRRLDLPLAAKQDLDDMLRLEMDRLTPFAADQVLSAHRIVAQDQRERRLTVELQVAPKAVVDDALELAGRLGATVERVELEPTGEDALALDLLPDRTTASGGHGITRALAVLALILAALAVALPLRQQHASLADLERQAAAAKTRAEESLALRRRLEALTSSAAFLVEEKTDAPMVSQVLAELTRIVPDTAYVSQLQLRDGTLQLHGFAETASALIGLLDASPLFTTPQFRSPVTQDPRLELERFHIGVKLAAGGGES